MCVLVYNFFALAHRLVDQSTYIIQLSKIPQEFIDKYNLTKFAHKGWVYFKIRLGCYGLPQSCILANKQLRNRLEKEGYYEAHNTPGLWRIKLRLV